MKKIQITLLLFLLISIVTISFAQSHTIEKVSGVQTNSIGTLKEGNEIVGYYMFFLKDALDKKTNLFELKILDANLNETYTKEMELPVKTMLQEVAYNKKTIGLKFYDLDRSDKLINSKSYIILKQIDISGTLVSKKKKELNSRSSAGYLDPYQADRFGLKVLEDKGYLTLIDVKNKKAGYSVLYVPSGAEEKSWTFGSKKDSEMLETGTFLTYQNDIAFFLVNKKKKLMTTKSESYIVAFNLSTRKLLFETLIDDSVIIPVIDKTFSDPISGETILVSQYYNKENTIKGGVIGIMITKINNEGKIINNELFPWVDSFSEYFSFNEKGKNEGDKMKLHFQEINIDNDGNIYLLAEEFKKSTSGKSIAKGIMTMGAGGGSNLVFSDMHLLKFSKDLKLKNVKKIEKKKTNFELPAMTAAFGSRGLMHMIKFAGTDYLFSIQENDNSSFSLIYIDREGTIGNFAGVLLTAGEITPFESGYHYGGGGNNFKKEAEIKIMTYKNGEYKTDSIPLNEDDCAINIYPGPAGKLLLARHYFDSQDLELSLIKINN